MAEQGGLLEQKAALDDVSRLLYGLIGPGDTEVQLRVNALTVVTGSIQVLVFNPEGRYATPDGKVNSPTLPFAVYGALDALRAAMYREGAGTWFSATFRVTAAGSATAEFDYEGEPRWDVPPAPGVYVADLESYPRDAEHIPEWLSARLAEAAAEG